jgi:hypothetical protein
MGAAACRRDEPGREQVGKYGKRQARGQIDFRKQPRKKICPL